MQPQVVSGEGFGMKLGGRQMAEIDDQPHRPIDRRRLFISTTALFLVIVLCLFLAAGTWAWGKGWLFLIVTVWGRS